MVVNKDIIRVMLVDDHDLVRTGIKHLLEDTSNIEVVAEASNGEDAIKIAREIIPEIVLMDFNMPGIGGLETTHKLLRSFPNIKVIILTVGTHDLISSRLLQAGAAGYLTKGASAEEMMNAVKLVQQGGRYISPEIASQLALSAVSQAESSPFESLSDRELQIILMVAQGMSVKSVADSLHLSTKTINSYRYRIFEKLEVKNDVEMTLLAIRHSLLGPEASGSRE